MKLLSVMVENGSVDCDLLGLGLLCWFILERKGKIYKYIER